MGPRSTVLVRPAAPSDSADSVLQLCALDYAGQTYTNFALIFEVASGADRHGIARTLEEALGRTVTQSPYLAGSVEPGGDGEYCLAAEPSSAMQFATHWLDSAGYGAISFAELKAASFSASKLGDVAHFTIPGLTPGGGKASPKARPPVAGFQLTFVPGGAVLAVQVHHWAMDAAGTASLVHQVAANYRDVESGAPLGKWDNGLASRERFYQHPLPEDERVEARSFGAGRHPDWHDCAWLSFRISSTKLAELKSLAMPTEGTWVSTYDATIAMLWRSLSRARAKIYHPDLETFADIGESCNMRTRLTPSVPQRYQGNLQQSCQSFTEKEKLSLADVVGDAPLAKLASYIRKLTNGATPAALEARMKRVHCVRDKAMQKFDLNSLPPMSAIILDWRDVDMCTAEFGSLGRPEATRILADVIMENCIVLLPRRRLDGGVDSGLEVLLPFEKHATHLLREDADLALWAEFTGFETAA